MSKLSFSECHFKDNLILLVCILVFIVFGFTYAHFTQKQVMTWFTPQDSEGKPITANEQIVNETQSDKDITIYLRAVYYQKDILYLSYSTKGNDIMLNQRHLEVYYNNELISSSDSGGMNRVKDTIYWGTGFSLTKHLTHGDKITIRIVKNNGEKTDLKFRFKSS